MHCMQCRQNTGRQQLANSCVKESEKMINDTLMEAVDLMIDICSDETQALGMSSVREFLGDYCESDWTSLSRKEKIEKFRQYMSCEVKENKK